MFFFLWLHLKRPQNPTYPFLGDTNHVQIYKINRIYWLYKSENEYFCDIF